MHFFKYSFTLVACMVVCVITHAQFVDYGSDPARLKWNVARTGHYKLIFPRGSDSIAYRYAAFLENAYPHIEKTIGSPKKLTIPVVLHTNNMVSNGMVAWAPRRMELITTPSPNNYSQMWDRQLALHESRHVMQTGKLAKGVFNPLYYITGEQIVGIAAYGIPKWFFEGDAVATETALSNSGRGRLPEFNMIYKAQLFSGKFFSFDKWFLGSYKNYTGDYYALGYNLTAYARYAFGADIWEKVTDRYTRRIYAIPPFSNALKHYTGLTTKALFNETFKYLHNEWDKQDKGQKHDKLTHISPDNKFYTSYKYPQIINDSTIIAVKSGLSDINSLVMLQNGKEKRLSYIGSINSKITLNNNRVYWSEYVPGIRWTHENYSVVKYYDLERQRIATLTPRQRYVSPTVDNSGKTLAVSEFSTAGNNSIVLISTEDGKAIKRYPVLYNMYVKEPVFVGNGAIITSAVGDKGLTILQLDTTNGDWYGLLRPTPANISSLAIHKGKLYFESGFNGTNNIYSFDTLSLKINKLTSAHFGAFTPSLSPDGKQLFYSDYQPNGYRVAYTPADSLKTETVNFTQPYRFPLAETLSRQEQYNLDSAELKAVNFNPKPYRKGLNLFKIHSWAPFFYDVADIVNMQADDFTTLIRPGATVLSQNELNTAIAQLGWYYKDNYHHGKFSFLYMGWFPVINIDVDYGGKAYDVKWTTDEENRNNLQQFSAKRNLVEAEAQVYLPLNFTRNHYIRGLQPSVSYYYTNNRFQQLESRKSRDYQYVLSELRYYHYRKMAQRDILPRWGYQLRLQYLNTPFDSQNFGGVFAARLTTYLPGFIRNDGLMLRLGYQHENVDDKVFYGLKQLLDRPRGHYTFYARQKVAFKADYSFNIICPDLAVGSLAYIKRLRANVFYDISTNENHDSWTKQESVGADIIMDCNAFRLNYPLSVGLRLIKPTTSTRKGNLQAEFLFSIAFQ